MHTYIWTYKRLTHANLIKLAGKEEITLYISTRTVQKRRCIFKLYEYSIFILFVRGIKVRCVLLLSKKRFKDLYKILCEKVFKNTWDVNSAYGECTLSQKIFKSGNIQAFHIRLSRCDARSGCPSTLTTNGRTQESRDQKYKNRWESSRHTKNYISKLFRKLEKTLAQVIHIKNYIWWYLRGTTLKETK